MRFRLPALLLLAPLAPAAAQSASLGGGPCFGEMVTAIEFRSHPPGSTLVADAWKQFSGFVGFQHVPTRPSVLNAYLQVAVGKRCTEFERTESERLLRAQPFIASASVQAVPTGLGTVKIIVETVDDLEPIIGGTIQGLSLQSLLIGTENLDGRGLTVELSAQRGSPYRPGFGGDLIQSGAFGKPLTLAVGGERDPLGDAVRFEFSKPFLTDLQASGFHLGLNENAGYEDLKRPVGDDVFLNVRHLSYDFGIGTRVLSLNRNKAIGVIGALVLGESANTATEGVFETDSGLVPAPGLAPIQNRYAPFSALHIGAFAGFRSLAFTTVRGFDALTAQQDVGRGVEFGVFGGPSLWESQDRSDLFLSSELYAGVGTRASFLEMRFQGEGRTDSEAQEWDGVVGYGKLVWYVKPSDRETHITTLELSGVQHLPFPVQLGFWDHIGGLPGFPNSPEVGGQRVILRYERRRVVHLITRRADWAVAGFVDAGKIWAGDVPFGQTSPVRTSVGVSLLAAYPAGGKRTYRVDFAVPLNPNGSRFELRFSSADVTRSIWWQPNDISQAHSGALLQNLGSWLPR